jgi:hypothetical protein
MTQSRTLQALLMGVGLIMSGCGESGEGPVVPPPPAPAEYADKHMPADWWGDAAKAEEGRKLFTRTSTVPAVMARMASLSRPAPAISAMESA